VQDLLGMDQAELMKLAGELGLPSFRGKQIFHWVQKKGITSLKEMTNISKNVQILLENKAFLGYPEIVTKWESIQGDTIKLLLRFSDGAAVETVLMVYDRENTRDRNTVCVSTQVGCSMGCGFCATGLTGVDRNLSAGEIIAQVWTAQRECRGKKLSEITNVVFMGMGEPLANLSQVLKSIYLLNDPQGLNIGMRRITVSTCGLVPQIYRLAHENLPVTLAISLHAADNDLRSELMPVNKKYPVQELIKAADYYAKQTGRRVTFEYALFKGINDREENARELGRLVQGHLAHVNIIPANPVPETGYERSLPPVVDRFSRILATFGVSVIVREEKGIDINAACGQLRRRLRGRWN